MKTLKEKIKNIDPEAIISLSNKYGVFYTGKAKFVFNLVTLKAWNSTDIKIII